MPYLKSIFWLPCELCWMVEKHARKRPYSSHTWCYLHTLPMGQVAKNSICTWQFNLEANRSIFGLLKCLQRFSNMSFLRVHSVLSSNTRDASLDSILSVLGQCVVRSPIWMEPIFNSPLAVAISAWVLSGKYITLTTTSPLGGHFNLLSEAWWNLPPRECDTRLGTCFCMFSVKASFQVSVTICIGQECDRVQCQIVKLFPVWVSFCLLPPWRFL